MMKKIRNRSHLHEEKMKLRIKELELEKAIQADWEGIKEKLQSETILHNRQTAHTTGHWLISGLSLAASALSKNILQKAEEKIEQKAEKGIEYLGSRVNHLLSRKK